MAKALSLPPHYDHRKVADTDQGGLWMVDYENIAAQAGQWAKQHDLQNTASDSPRICVVPVDVQITFLMKGGGLAIPGALNAARLGVEFGYRWMHYITRWMPTLDTHSLWQIFHAIFLVDDKGEPPPPFAQITGSDVRAGKWRINQAAVSALFPELDKKELSERYAYLDQYLGHYTESLQSGGKFTHTIWPYHAMLGGIEHALLPSLHEAIFFHGVARGSDRNTQIKGDLPLSENYSPLQPEVLRDHLGKPIGEKNVHFIETMLTYDHIISWGFASSHCFAWFVDDLLTEIKARDPSLVKKVYLLKYATAPVPAIPNVVDFPALSEQAFSRFSSAGIHVIDDPDLPMDKWPDMSLK